MGNETIKLPKKFIIVDYDGKIIIYDRTYPRRRLYITPTSIKTEEPNKTMLAIAQKLKLPPENVLPLDKFTK